MPATLSDSHSAHEYFARWGDVVHVGLSLDYRDVIVSAEERRQLRLKLNNAQVGRHSLRYLLGGRARATETRQQLLQLIFFRETSRHVLTRRHPACLPKPNTLHPLHPPP